MAVRGLGKAGKMSNSSKRGKTGKMGNGSKRGKPRLVR